MIFDWTKKGSYGIVLATGGSTEMKKGTVEFHSKGPTGNIYYIIGAAQSIMRKQRRINEYNKMWESIQKAKEYKEALKIIAKHINLVDLDGLYKF